MLCQAPKCAPVQQQHPHVYALSRCSSAALSMLCYHNFHRAMPAGNMTASGILQGTTLVAEVLPLLRFIQAVVHHAAKPCVSHQQPVTATDTRPTATAAQPQAALQGSRPTVTGAEADMTQAPAAASVAAPTAATGAGAAAGAAAGTAATTCFLIFKWCSIVVRVFDTATQLDCCSYGPYTELACQKRSGSRTVSGGLEVHALIVCFVQLKACRKLLVHCRVASLAQLPSFGISCVLSCSIVFSLETQNGSFGIQLYIIHSVSYVVLRQGLCQP